MTAVTGAVRAWLDRPLPATVTVAALLLATAWGVSHFPRSIVLFMLSAADMNYLLCPVLRRSSMYLA